jgi:mRNA interferase MazF
MTTVKAGELWVAEITFTDSSASKKRPVLILWTDGDDVVVAVTSSPRSHTDVILIDWAQSGLRVASTVRLSRLNCLERSLLLKKLGQLSAGDAQALMEVWIQQISDRETRPIHSEQESSGSASQLGGNGAEVCEGDAA